MSQETAIFLDKFLRWAVPIGVPILFGWLCYAEWKR